MKQRKIEYPGGGAWVLLPPEWLGKHMSRRDQIIEGLGDKVTDSLRYAAIALAIVDDFDIPGMGRKTEDWNFDEVPVGVIQWLKETVFLDFGKSFIVPKKKSKQSPDGLKEKPAKATDGDLGKKKSA